MTFMKMKASQRLKSSSKLSCCIFARLNCVVLGRLFVLSMLLEVGHLATNPKMEIW